MLYDILFGICKLCVRDLEEKCLESMIDDDVLKLIYNCSDYI